MSEEKKKTKAEIYREYNERVVNENRATALAIAKEEPPKTTVVEETLPETEKASEVTEEETSTEATSEEET